MEKSLFNQVGEVKGKVSETEESFSFQFTPQNENLRRTRGSLFTLVTVKGKSEERYEKAKAYYHAFQSSYYAKASGSIINGLSETLDQLEKDFSHKDEGLQFSLVAAVFWGAVLYLARNDNSGVWVSRGERLKKIDFNKVASGVLEDQDTVCLVSEKFEQAVDQEELGKWLALEKFEDVLSEIDKKVTSVEGGACVVIRLGVHDPQEETETLAISEVDEQGDVVPETVEEVETTQEEKAKEPENMMPLDKQPEKLEAAPVEQMKEKTGAVLEKLQPAFRKATSVGKSVFARIAKPWKKPKPGELVDHVAIRRQRLAQIVVVIIVVLAFSLVRNFSSQQDSSKQEEFNTLVASIQSQLDEARNIQSIDPSRALTIVSDAKGDIEEAKKLDEENSQINSLETEASELLAEITRTYPVEGLQTAADFSTLVSGAAINNLALLGSNIFAADQAKNSVYSFNLDTGNVEKINGTYSSPKNIASFDQGIYVQNAANISRYLTNGNTSNVASGGNWGNIVGAATFQANLYLLDQGNGEIWRYRNTSSGLTSAQAYITGEKPDLSSATGIAIDDYVWVVTKEGLIYKLGQGEKLEFSISNLSDTFDNVVGIFTDGDSQNLYILDQGKGSIVVIGKDGVYQEQYAHEELKKATSLVVKEEQKMVYFSNGSKIVSFGLR